jgi:hypothetical protein
MYLEGGFKLIFEREGPLEIRITDPRILAMVGQEVGSKENVTFKILFRGKNGNPYAPEDDPEVIKIEISSDHDYFFFYKQQ